MSLQLFSYHRFTAPRTLYLVTGKSRLMLCRCPARRAYALASGTRPRSASPHPSSASGHTHSSPCFRPATARTRSIASRHTNHLLTRFCAQSDRAPSGHSSTQVPHSTHSSSLTFDLSSSTSMASTGHTSAQVPQPVHFSKSTCTGIAPLLSFISLPLLFV